jgi:SAM-dependent methyltransferase
MAEPSDLGEFWARTGPSWVRHADLLDEHLAAYGEAGIEALAPVAGDRVVDIGCGCGATTLVLGRRVTEEGAVTGVDIAAPMLEVARRRAEAVGLTNVSFVEGDAATVDLAEASGGPLDAAFSRFGAMFFTDPVAAFGNIGAALRPGGRLSLVVWQPREANHWNLVATNATDGILGDAPVPAPPGQPGPFGLADEDLVRSVLAGAGFADVDLAPFTTVDVLRADALDEDIARLLQMGPMRTAWDEAGAEARAAAVQAVRAALGHYAVGPDRYELPGAARVVTARRP